MMPSYTEVSTDKEKYCEAFNAQTREQDAVRGKHLLQPHERATCSATHRPPALAKEWTRSMRSVYAKRTRSIAGISRVEGFRSPLPRARLLRQLQLLCVDVHQGASCGQEPRSICRGGEEDVGSGLKGISTTSEGPTAKFRHPACEKQLKRGVARIANAWLYACKQLDTSEDDYCRALAKPASCRA